MSNNYILSSFYIPSSAATNHALSFIKGFDELGLKAEWLFILPDEHESKCPITFNNITIRYLWKNKFNKNKIVKHIYKHFSYAKFYFSLKPDDNVLLLGTSAYLYNLVRREGVNIYHERTEHPYVGKISRFNFFSLKRYLNSCKKVTGLFVITKALQDFFISQGVSSSKIHVVNMVVNGTRFIDIKRERVEQPYIVYCGNAQNSKDGVDDLLRAFAIIVNNIDIRLKIIGPAPSVASPNWILANTLNITDKVDFLGIIEPQKIPQLLTNAEVAALARPQSLQNTYGFPTKLGEYLMSSVPVCVTSVGDIPLFLKHMDSALLSPCGDVEEFAQNLEWCIEHPVEAKLIGANGKKVALECFNYKSEAKKIIDVIQNQDRPHKV